MTQALDAACGHSVPDTLPYYADACEAVRLALLPMPNDDMQGFRLTHWLGIPQTMESNWRHRGEFPYPARFAMAALMHRRAQAREVKPYDLRVLSNVERAKGYYLVRGEWRARVYMGQRYPRMRYETPLALVHRGFLALDDDKLTITTRGRDLIYG